ncbi:sigma-70 family RNA polymerase sigma factor [Streptococcus ovis]
MEFKTIYSKVSGIVEKARKEYYVKSWEHEDWEQEGMLVLYELLSSDASITEDMSRLYVYYKVKFRNHVKDKIRRQESQKRKFDRMSYEEIGGLSHMLSTGGLMTDERLALRSILHSYQEGLDSRGQEQYEKFISGQRFKGRQKMLQDLRATLSDFQEE